MGGKGGLKKQPLAAKKARRASAGSDASPAAEPRRSKRVVAGAAESSAAAAADDEVDAPPRPMELDPATTAEIKSEVAKKVNGVRPTPEGAGVLYLGHIPHGFYEEQMRGFFSQFGTVSRLRLARNKKTGRSKHYAFIEFRHAEVGEVVAKAMNGYLLFSKVLVAKLMAPKEVHPETFKNANRKFKFVDRTMMERKLQNRARLPEEAAKREANLLVSDAKKRKKLAELGIEYEFGGYAEAAERSQKRTRGVLTTEPSKPLLEDPTATALAPPAKKRKAAAAVDAAAEAEMPAARLQPPAKVGKVAKAVPKAATVEAEQPVQAEKGSAGAGSGKKGKKGARAVAEPAVAQVAEPPPAAKKVKKAKASAEVTVVVEPPPPAAKKVKKSPR